MKYVLHYTDHNFEYTGEGMVGWFPGDQQLDWRLSQIGRQSSLRDPNFPINYKYDIFL
jgi:hypothetical protein